MFCWYENNPFLSASLSVCSCQLYFPRILTVNLFQCDSQLSLDHVGMMPVNRTYLYLELDVDIPSVAASFKTIHWLYCPNILRQWLPGVDNTLSEKVLSNVSLWHSLFCGFRLCPLVIIPPDSWRDKIVDASTAYFSYRLLKASIAAPPSRPYSRDGRSFLRRHSS